jgi:2-oxoglutarate ferredoxin oxidoreductase subunit alpha
VQSIEAILVATLKKSGFNVFATKEYMSRVRGGVNSTQIIVSDAPVRAHSSHVDLLIPLTEEAIAHVEKRYSSPDVILADTDRIDREGLIDLPLHGLARELGNPLYASSIAAGAVCGILGADHEVLRGEVHTIFATKDEEVIAGNVKAAERGYAVGQSHAREGRITASLKKRKAVREHLLLNGAHAVAIGALAGGCDAVFAYPMTPSTSVFTALAGYSKKLDIVVEQVEDEIGVINMALGAWYGGARALVSTSGGGFALMSEGLSLAGMIETPVVVHLAQRPGPATGLPTRTEQGDLNLALHAGHGHFPRIVLAPGTTTEAFLLARRAFNLADRFQVPVIILTDQYFVDSYYNIPAIKTDRLKAEKKHVVETASDYTRYAFTRNGVSPRGIPGFGAGMVCVDSDEHDETGRITEDLEGVRMRMVDKRMRKERAVRKAALKPRLIGPDAYKTLVVGWGSTCTAIARALDMIDTQATAFVHFPQVYPLHASTARLLEAAEKVIVVENNETGQFAELIMAETGIAVDERVLKYNGMPFSVEELAHELGELCL